MGTTGLTYEIIGAGNSSDNKIKVIVECGVTSTTICWIGRTIFFDGCNNHIKDTKVCEEVTVPSSGKIYWNGEPVYYEVTAEPCPPDPETACTYTCDNDSVKSWTVPYYIPEGYTDDIEVYYEYRKIGYRNGEVCGVINKAGHKSVAPTTTSITVDGCTIEVNTTGKTEDDCTPGTVVTLSVSFTPPVVPASGGTITVNVTFKKVVTDENCVKKETSGGWGFPWTIECEPTESNPYYCCVDHMVTSAITISEIRTKLKIDNTAKIVYNGIDVSNKDKIEYSVLQKAKYTEECSGFCEEKTTYCADQSSVKVCYETKWMSNEWVCEGESAKCDCTALSIDGINGNMVVPFTGGRIKVTWNYSAHTTTRDCQEFDSTGKWEEIIAIGGCDERPTECKDEYNKVVINKEGGTGVYDNDTYQGCEICDAECCYNYDGNGKCKCVILWKERTPDCKGKNEGGCDQITIYDNELDRMVTYNKIHYEFVQDCTPTCDYSKYIEYDKKEYTLDKCFESETSYTVNYRAVLSYEGVGCPPDEETTGSETVTLTVRKNNSGSEKLIIDDDRIKVTQDKGPCDDESTCDCDALEIEGGGCTDKTVYDTVNLTCDKHENEKVNVNYRVICGTEEKSTGSKEITINLPCNSGLKRSYTIDGVTVYQAGGCSCETPPPEECTSWGNRVYDNSVSVTCYSHDSVNLGYTETCLTDTSKTRTGNVPVTVNIPCNSSTSSTSYTKTYDSHTFTVNQAAGDCCGGTSCTCRTEGDKSDFILPATDDGVEHKVGTYSTNCSGDWDEVTHKQDSDFLKDFRFSGGYIYAKIKNNNDGAERSGKYNTGIGGCTDYFTAYQSGSGGGDCLCSITSDFNYSNGAYPSTGSSIDGDKVGTITYKEGCTSTKFDRIEIRDGGPSSIWSSASDFDIKPNGEVWAVVPPNSHNVILHIRVYFKCKDSTTASDYDYFNFYQAAGSTPQPTECDVTADSTLDGYVSKFNNDLGTNITVSNTPCTYLVLKEIYNKVSSTNKRTIMWALAEMLTELTPDASKSTKYFETASKSDYGGVPDLISSESVYNDRLAGATAYTKWRHDSFSDVNSMAEKARTELRANGISEAKLIDAPTNTDGTFNFPRGTVINPLNIVPNMGGQTSIGNITSSDKTKMYDILSKYPDADSIINGNTSTGGVALGTDPFADKEYCSKRLLQIMGGQYTNSSWITFIDNVKDATDAAVNVIKRGSGSVQEQKRLRPTGQDINGKTANMVCDTSGAEAAARTLCGDGDSCESEYNRYVGDTGSYPSGHSGRGYIAGLAYLEASGTDKTSRMSDYCYHRSIVRAHWVSDTIAAKVIASTVIGFLNGVNQYLTQVNNLRN